MQEHSIASCDTSWILVSTALVLLMTPGLAFFYAGLVRRRNVINTLMMSFAALGVVSVVWASIGYSLAFAPGNGWVGGLDYLGLAGVGLEALEGTSIPHILFMAFQMMFAIIAPALISGAVVGRMKFSSYLLFVGLWSLIVYSPLCHWVWGGGWLSESGALDFAGGTVVHISAGVSALVAAWILGPRSADERASQKPHHIPMTMLGAALLWFGWFGFNAGSALGAGAVAANALVTTHLAASTALLSWLVLDLFVKRRTSGVGVAMGAIVGLVTITPAAGFVTAGGAIAMGFLGTLCSYGALHLLERLELDDCLDVFACHGVAGMVGALLTGVFATTSVNEGGANGVLYGSWDLMGPQLEGVVAALVIGAVGTGLILKVLQATVGIRVPGTAERALDQAEHDERAYVSHEGKLLGQLILEQGLMGEADLHACLEEQTKAEVPMRLGEILQRKGVVDAARLQQILQLQQSMV
ncbi:MAG: ammonium transporter [Myxococcota bacterium]|nr:ammonium transporter [Myxococcota bacterium]